jgi:hypothetical protein
MSNDATTLQTQPEIRTPQAFEKTTDILAIVEQMDGLKFLGQTLVKSGMLPRSINTTEAAVAIILTGNELGIPPMQAFSSINVIQGKPTISPQLMIALADRSGALENHELSDDGHTATCSVKRRNRAAHTATFSMDDAKNMGLAGKDNWKKQPKVMRMWRAVSAAFRVTFPDVLAGIYIPEEMGAQVDSEGIVSVEAEVTTTSSTIGSSSAAPAEPAMPPAEPEEIRPWIETPNGLKYAPHFDEWLTKLGEDVYNGILRNEGCVTRSDIVSPEMAKRIVGAMKKAVAEQRAPWAKPEDAEDTDETVGGWPQENAPDDDMPPALIQDENGSLTGMVDGQPD